MDDLRLALLVIGILVVVAIYWYGRWEMRRERTRHLERQRRREPTLDDPNAQTESPEEPAEPEDVFGAPAEPESGAPSLTPADPPPRKEEEEAPGELDDLANLVEEAKERLPEKNSEHNEAQPDKKGEKPEKKDSKKGRFRLAPRWKKAKPEAALTPPPEAEPEPELIVVLTVVAPGQNRFRGKDIVRLLEEQGLRHGEMDIFHAYSPGERPVFSVANIVEPGTFDLQTIDRLVTPGLTLFLRLPGPSGGFAAFDALLETARMLAKRLNGEIRDERRNVLTAQAIQQIRERILVFNRTRRSMGI